MLRSFAMFLAVACVVPVVGCALLEEGRSTAESRLKFRDRDYRDDVNFGDEYHDENDGLQREARGDQPMDHESDRMTKWWSSPKARAIERNLNVD